LLANEIVGEAVVAVGTAAHPHFLLDVAQHFLPLPLPVVVGGLRTPFAAAAAQTAPPLAVGPLTLPSRHLVEGAFQDLCSLSVDHVRCGRSLDLLRF
jgi:hypothetical protein